MAIGDIQLTKAAMPTPERQQVAVTAPGGDVVYGESSVDTETPPELENTALPREQVEAFLWEVQHQPAWRREADRCADYYDGNQLNQETVEKLEDRGQPPLITNLIKPTIDTVLGMEAKSRTDWIVRTEDEMVGKDMADALSFKLKHAETESRADRACSDAYAAQMKAGIGFVEVARETDPFKFPYRAKSVHRRELFWDWRSELYDWTDSRYCIRRRWLELDGAIAMMPQYANLFRMTTSAWGGFDPITEQDTKLIQSFEVERDTRINATDWRDIQRQRVCLYEIWYRKWVRGFVLHLPDGRVVEADFSNPKHNEAIVAGLVKVTQATFQKVRLAWYCGPHFLYDVPSPYKHGYFPYVPFFGYREDLTQAPYGLVRAMMSPQDEVNARKSKMLWLLNSRRVITDADAVTDHNKAMQEVARADAYVILNEKRKPTSTFKVEVGGELATQQFQSMQESKQEIAEASGIHKSMQGQQSAASSGLAINSLIEQGLNTLAEINDNYRFARRMVGEMLFSLMQEDLTGRPIPVTLGEGSRKKTIVLNQPVSDPETGQMSIQNDVARIRAKVVLDDIPSTATFRMQQLQMLTEITKSLPPQAQALIIDFVVAATDLPGREEVVDRLRKGLNLPDDSPEAQQAQAQAAQQQQAIQQRTIELELEAKEAAVESTRAQTQKTLADLETARLQAQGDPGSQNAIAQAVAQVQQASDAQVQQLNTEIADLRQALQEKEIEAANRQAEIESKGDVEAVKQQTELEKARAAAAAQIKVAEINAASDEKIKSLEQRCAELQQQVAEAIRIAKETPPPAPAPVAPPPAPTPSQPVEATARKRNIHVVRDENQNIVRLVVDEV